MCKNNLKKASWRWITGVICTAGLLCQISSTVQAQTPPGCVDNASSSAIGIISGNPTIIGGTVCFTARVGVPVTGCEARGVNAFVKLPNGIEVQILSNVTIAQNESIECPADPRCINRDALCYQVRCEDLGDRITTTLVAPGGSEVSPAVNPSPTQYGAVVAAIGSSQTEAGNDFTAGNTITGNVLLPCISATKECVNQCTPYGQPIEFRGQVCNTGNTPLFNIAITDTPDGGSPTVIEIPAGTMTIPPPGGTARVYDGRLNPGECLPYSGSYVPVNNLCGPLTDTIEATGEVTGISGVPDFTVRNTDACLLNADGTVNCGATARPAVTATCHVQANPYLNLEKLCYKVDEQGNPVRDANGNLVQTLNVGDRYVYEFRVTNPGGFAAGPIRNVRIFDSINGGAETEINSDTPGAACLAGPIAPGADPCVVILGPFTATAADCPTITDAARATAENYCPPDAVCPNNRTAEAGPVTCTLTILCPCDFTIQKYVACYLGNGECGTFGPYAIGVRNSACPAFCYQYVIENTGTIPLRVNVVDDKLGDISAKFPVLQPGDPPFTVTISPATDPDLAVEGKLIHCGETPGINCGGDILIGSRNTVEVRCYEADGTTLSEAKTSSADVCVRELDVECELTLNSSVDQDTTDPRRVLLPADSAGSPVEVSLTIRNTGTADFIVTRVTGLENLVYCSGDNIGQPITEEALAGILGLPLEIPAGESITVALVGCLLVDCPAGASLSVQVYVEADDEEGTICVNDRDGQRITDVSDACTAVVECENPVSCRVTGGGVLLPGDEFVQDCDETTPNAQTIVSGPNCNGQPALKITHGGQLGAPYGNTTCGDVAQFPQGDPCIRGQWQHVRHYQGKANPRSSFEVDNFHSNTPRGVFDTLQCACLPCCENPDATGIQGELCNPDDHKICGPEPRPAPANAIIFSGVGYIRTCESQNNAGRANRQPVVFVVYIEDRSEPGGSKPGGAQRPDDIYCFQAWPLSGNDIASLENISTRQAVADAACAFIAGRTSGALRQGTLPSTSNVFANLGEPSINDCGAMSTGNHQIHPSTSATCK